MRTPSPRREPLPLEFRPSQAREIVRLRDRMSVEMPPTGLTVAGTALVVTAGAALLAGVPA